MKKEIELNKNPATYASKHRNNLSESDIEKNFNSNLNSKNNNLNDNTYGNVNLNNINSYNPKSYKSDFINYKNEDSAFIKFNSSIDHNDDEVNNKISVEVTNNKETIKKLNEELGEIKTANSKVESEISNLNNELSSKFCFIYQLEKKLDRLRKKVIINADVNENVNEDKIQKKFSLPFATKLNLHNFISTNPKRLQTTFETSKFRDLHG